MNDNSTFLLFLFLGLAVTWLGIVAYVMYVGARLRAVERDLESLGPSTAVAPERPSGPGMDQDEGSRPHRGGPWRYGPS